MRGSSAIALSIGIGAVIGATVMGVPAIREHFFPSPITATAPIPPAPVPMAATPAVTPPAAANTPTPEAANPSVPVPPAAASTTSVQAEPTPAAVEPSAAATAAGAFDVKAALQDRVLGNPDAPVTFYDYSSLSCPHCADFHTHTLIQIRQHYIDEGKVKMVFRPFPLNQPALLGEKIARCVPQDQYFKILDLLFSSQDKWVFASDVQGALRQMVKVAGVTDKMFDDCMANEELEKGIMQIANDGVAHHNLKGTPSFVFGSDMPNAEVVAGELSFEDFSKKLDALLRGETTTPAASEAGAMSNSSGQ